MPRRVRSSIHARRTAGTLVSHAMSSQGDFLCAKVCCVILRASKLHDFEHRARHATRAALVNVEELDVSVAEAEQAWLNRGGIPFDVGAFHEEYVADPFYWSNGWLLSFLRTSVNHWTSFIADWSSLGCCGELTHASFGSQTQLLKHSRHERLTDLACFVLSRWMAEGRLEDRVQGGCGNRSSDGE
jgi:hypothetical protein